METTDRIVSKKKISLSSKVDTFDKQLLVTQQKTADRYANYFSFNISLFFMMASGASFAFVGRDCYGTISFDSPLFVSMILFTGFILFQTFISLPLNTVRLFKLIGIFYFTFTLTSEVWGLYSMEYLDVQNACKPTLYMNSFHGFLRAILPDIILILICYTGNKDEIKQ